ncbi:retrotransposon protein, putative, unclassified [Tanacetum coccineum]
MNEAWFLESKKGVRVGEGKNKVVAAKDVVSPSVIDEPMAKEKQSSFVDTSIPNVENTDLRSYPLLPTQGTTLTGNTLGMSLYANVGVPNMKALSFRTLYTPGENEVDVVVSVESIRAISERFANTAYGLFLGKRVAYPVIANYVRHTWGKYGLVKSMLNSSTGLFSFQFSSTDGLNAMLENDTWFIRNHSLILKKSSYARAMIELRTDMELKDTIMEECPKNPGLGVAKNLKKPIQASRDVLVGPEVGFKPPKEYRPVSKKPTTITSCTKKKGVEPTKEVSNSNPFDVLNWVENDKELGTNGGTSNLGSNGANSCGSSFWKKVTLVDDDGKPLKKVDYLGDHDSEDEVESVGANMTCSMASERVGFDTKSLLEQWRDTYESGYYDEDLYDDDMFEGQDVPDKIQDICNNLDIRIANTGDAKFAITHLFSFDFVKVLHLMKKIMESTEKLCKVLHNKSQDIVTALTLVSTINTLIQNLSIEREIVGTICTGKIIDDFYSNQKDVSKEEAQG